MSNENEPEIHPDLLSIVNAKPILTLSDIEAAPYDADLHTNNMNYLKIGKRRHFDSIENNKQFMLYHILKYENPEYATTAFSELGFNIMHLYDQNNGVLPILSYHDTDISQQIITEPMVTLDEFLNVVVDWKNGGKLKDEFDEINHLKAMPFILRIRDIQKSYQKNDLDSLLRMVNKSARLKTLEQHIVHLNAMPIDDALDHIVSSYVLSEYGFNDINWSLFDPIIKNCPVDNPYHPSKTPSTNGTVTLYRGESTKSTSYENAVSWTTNLKDALFFATRFADDADIVRLHTVNIDAHSPNLLLYIGGNESEVWLNSKNLDVNTQIDTVANIKNHYK